MGRNLVASMFRAAAVALPLLAAHVADAHDVWLSPERFALDRGDDLIVRQLAGGEGDSEILRPDRALELPFLTGMTPRFELLTPERRIDLLGELRESRTQMPRKPVLNRRIDVEGLGLVVMDHDLIYADHKHREFLLYLEHESFETKDFTGHMGSRNTQTEAYARSLKSLFQIGAKRAGDLHGRIVGQRLEILLLQNPYLLDPGADIDVQVLFRGEPLSGALVRVYNRKGQGTVAAAEDRTNKVGVARFKLRRPGHWLVRLVHLMPCSDRASVDCDDADWESYWATYTFQLD